MIIHKRECFSRLEFAETHKNRRRPAIRRYLSRTSGIPAKVLKKECDFTSTVIAFQGYQNRLMVFEKCCCGAQGVGEAY
jgi:hypothetical protein